MFVARLGAAFPVRNKRSIFHANDSSDMGNVFSSGICPFVGKSVRERDER